MKHVYEGKKCIFCTEEDWYTKSDICPNRAGGSEPFMYSTESGAALETSSFALDERDHLSIFAYDDGEEVAEVWASEYNGVVSVFLNTVKPFYAMKVWTSDDNVIVQAKEGLTFEIR